MGDSYSYKDILFGLYKEYVMLQGQLNSLNKYILLDENKLEGVKFSLISNLDNEKVRVLCTLYDRKNKLERLLSKLHVFDVGNFKVSYLDKMNGKYEILQYPEVLDRTMKQEFSQSVMDILDTDFCNNMKLIYYGTGYDNIPFLSVDSRGIFTSLNDIGYLSFDSLKDLYLYANIFDGRLSKDKMQFMLNMEFSNRRFPEYYKNLIENNDNFGKKVEIYGDFGYSKKGKFEIIEESKKLVLVRK